MLYPGLIHFYPYVLLPFYTGTNGRGDDSLSSSELRRHYLLEPKDGGIEDSSLTASQLRARYGIQGRTHGNNSDAGVSPTMLAMLVVACGVLVAVVSVAGKEMLPS